MNYRPFGNTGFKASEIALGTWQLGGGWGKPFSETLAQQTLQAAVDGGVNLFDTADIYQDGQSECAIGRFLHHHPNQQVFVVTKMGRGLNPHVAEGYNKTNLLGFVDRSRKQQQRDTLDLTLLHCPPSVVFGNDKVFEALEQFKNTGLIKHYGVSIEKVEEGLEALKYPIQAIEVIFNMFRQKPAETLFARAAERGVAILVRVPLASGLLSGRYTAQTTFEKDDHRSFNREGAAFDKGETFSGVPYQLGIDTAAELQRALGVSDLAPWALRWILMHPQVSAVIPGASVPEQVAANLQASSLPALNAQQMQLVTNIYNQRLRSLIHPQW